MSKRYVLAATAVGLFFTACQERVAGIPAKPIEAIPPSAPIADRVFPGTNQKLIQFVFPRQETKDTDLNIAVHSDVSIRRGAAVIIDIPESEQNKKNLRKIAEKTGVRSEEERKQQENAERTNGEFTVAQQEFERALISVGLTILDRKKFEAKLRDARDAVPKRWDESWQKQKMTFKPGYETLKKQIEDDFAKKVISEEEFKTRMEKALNEYAQGREGGNKRTEDEMNDTAEIIRASLLGDKDEVKPDYLLQLEMKPQNSFPRYLTLKDRPEYQAFTANNPEFVDLAFFDPTKENFDNTKFPTQIKILWYYVDAQAKLIDIKTGSVVWIGSTRQQSGHIEEYQASYTVSKSVDSSWIDGVSQRIRQYNSRTAQLTQSVRQAESALNDVRTRYSQETTMDAELVADYKARRDQALSDAEKAYDQAREELRQHQQSQLTATSETPRFVYSVSPALISPDLSIEGLSGERFIQLKEIVAEHKGKLYRKAAQTLINTLPVKAAKP